MDKNKDNTFDVPAADIQDKITLLMGLPPEEAAARLDKASPPKRISSRQVRSATDTPMAAVSSVGATDTPETVAEPAASVVTGLDVAADDEAVDAIVKEEADTLLHDRDTKESAFMITPRKPKGVKRLISAWWSNRRARNMTFLIGIALIVAIIAIPTTRYSTLNALGIRAGIQFQVTDKISGRPIKNVAVTVNGVSGTTDTTGNVQLSGLRLGDTTVVLKKRSFKEEAIPVTIGWGSNPFDAPLELVPTGSTFTFNIKDWLSGLPLQNVEVSDGESVALSDKDGIAKLTIEPTDNDIAVSFASPTYRTENITIAADQLRGDTVSLVPSRKDIFVSKRQGKYDIYSRNVDGSNEQLLLAGTGSEQADTHVLVHPTEDITAMVSSRDGERNSDGYMLSNVYLLQPDTKNVEKLPGTSSERVRLISWSGDVLVFVKTIAGPSAYTGNRQRIIAYDVSEKSFTELAATDYFTDVRVVNDAIYYIVPNSDGSQSKGLTKSSVTGKEKKVLLAKNIWAMYRSAPGVLTVDVEGEEWYDITLADNTVKKLEGAPAVPQNNLYITNTASGSSAWLEDRDGKTALLVVNKDGSDAKEILKQAGITYPVRWLNDTTLLFTVANGQETADYVVSTLNGVSKRVGDMTISVYADNQYYY